MTDAAESAGGRPLIVGLTGSIGMGKSTVAKMFEDEGIAVFDADAEVHRLQGPDGALISAIEAAFPGTTGPYGVDRKALGAAVLGDKAKLTQLESIIHPAVGKARMAFFAAHQNDDMVVVDIPLLFETGGSDMVDVVIVVSAAADQQRARVLARDGMTKERFEQILALQTPDSEKRARADHVIYTGATLDETRKQLRKIVKKLRQGLAQRHE
ncbi:dephospho-CoA kinase [Sphingorhabdus arenilitoris]|uniref:Dephospho-CoA kinase n=1 Tax=Sphingorhabdus arenilitoris TaxID=1490041 RepID=A0ABV8RDL5_9SPHN